MKQNFQGANQNNDDTPMNMEYLSWFFEKELLDIYYLLVHRIEGLGWSLSDFWEADNYTTSYLYCRELELIEYEKEQYNDKDNKPKGIRGEQSEIESDEFNKLLEEYAEID